MTYLSTIFVSIFRYGLFWDKLRVKKSTLIVLYLSILTFGVLIFYNLGFYTSRQSSNIARFCIYSVMVVMSFFLIKDFKHTYSKQIFVFSVFIPFSTFVASLITPLEPIFMRKNLPNYDILLSLMLFGCICLMIPIVWKFFFIPCKKIINNSPESIWNTSISLMAILVFVNLVYLTGTKNLLISERIIFRIITNFVSVFLSFITIRLINTINDNNILNQELETTQKFIDMQSKYYDSVKDNYEITRKMRHDLKHHLLVINGLVEKNKNSDALEYINNIMQDISSIHDIIICSNESINIILNRYQQLCSKNNIAFDVKISIPNDKLFVSINDMCVLIGNLLENSYEACMLQTDFKKSIRVRGEYTPNKFIFIISNTFNGNIYKKDNNYISSKDKHRIGIGTQSIKSIVHKYNGSYDVQVYNNIFQSKILLYKE